MNFQTLKTKTRRFLRWSEKYFKTDMVYLAHGGFWLGLTQFFSALIAFLLSIAYANLLPKEILGNYKYILSIFGILTAFTLTGLKTATAQSVARGYEGILKKGYVTNLKWSVPVVIFSILASIYYYLNGNSTLSSAMIILAASLPFLNSAGLYNPFLNGKKLFKQNSIYSITNIIAQSFIIFIAISSTKNVFYIILIYFFSSAAINNFFYFLTLKKFKANDNFDPSSLAYGKHLSLMNILGTVATYFDKILVFHYVGAAQLAIYVFAVAIPEQISSLFKNIYTLSLPKFARKSIEEIKKNTWGKILKFGLILLGLTLIYIVLAPLIFKIFFPAYKESVFYSKIYSLTLISVLTYIPLSILHAQNKTKELYKLNILTAFIQISILLFFVRSYGLLGAVSAQVLSRFINLAIFMAFLKKIKS